MLIPHPAITTRAGMPRVDIAVARPDGVWLAEPSQGPRGFREFFVL